MTSRKIEVLVGLFVALAIAAFLLLSLKVANSGMTGSGQTYMLYAKFENIGGLKVRSPIKVGGVVVGESLIAIGEHGAAAVPSAPADDVHGVDRDGVRGADHRADIGVVAEVLDRDVQRMPTEVDVGDDRLASPIPIGVNDIAGVAVREEFGVEARVLRRRTFVGLLPRPDAEGSGGPLGGTGV